MSSTPFPAHKRRRGIAENEEDTQPQQTPVISVPTHASISAPISPPLSQAASQSAHPGVTGMGASAIMSGVRDLSRSVADSLRNPLSPAAIPQPARLPSHIDVRKSSFMEDYELGDVLGHGTFSIVRKCIHRATGEIRAVKIIDTQKFRLSSAHKGEVSSGMKADGSNSGGLTPADGLSPQLIEEVRILSALSAHPNILKLHDIYKETIEKNKHCLLIVTEWARGGELFDSIIKAGNFSETQARWVLWQCLNAIHYMHKSNILHRDLKPENILVFDTLLLPVEDPIVRPHVVYPSLSPHERVPSTRIAMLSVKVADFGVARYIGAAAASGASTFVGSPQYVAPEILAARQLGKAFASYGKPVDVYSLGVILYVCLAGYLPFDDNAPRPADAPAPLPTETWEDRAKTGRFYFAPPVWTHISDSVKDLIRRMMDPDPMRRITVTEAMSHSWFAPVREVSVAIDATLPDISSLRVETNPPAVHPAAANVSSTALTFFTGPRLFGGGGSGGGLPMNPPSINTSSTSSSLFGGPTFQFPPTTAAAGFTLHPATSTSSVGSLSALSGAARGVSSGNTPAFTVPSPSNAGMNVGMQHGGGIMQPLSPLPREYQLHVLHAVANSLNFDMLLTLQRGTASTFEAAYAAVSDIPQAAMVVRRHAVHSRDLQLHGVRKVIMRCKNIAESILGMLPDLMESIVENDRGLTQGCFEKMREWISELKVEAQSMKSAYSSLISDVQVSLEQARALQPTTTTTTTSSVMDVAASAGSEHVARVSSFDSDMTNSAPHNSSSPSASTRTHAMKSPERLDSPAFGIKASTPVIRPDQAAALAEAVLSGNVSPPPPTTMGSMAESKDVALEKEEVMELLLDPPSVITDNAKFARAWESLRSEDPLMAPLKPPAFTTASSSGSVDSRGDAPAAMQPFSRRTADPGECLTWALKALHNVDDLLSQAIEFWTSMELITDVVARRKEHSETLLKYSTSARMIAKATASLQDYSAFWQAFAYLCETYAEGVVDSTKTMYSWLSNAHEPIATPQLDSSPGASEASGDLNMMLAGSNVGRNGEDALGLDGIYASRRT